MDLMEAIEARHAVRAYTERAIEPAKAQILQRLIDKANDESGLKIQLCLESPAAFDSILAKYGVFTKVRNYIALVGNKSDKAALACGYHGEKLVLAAQKLGLNTCWVGGTYSKRKVVAQVGLREKLHLVIALGYGETQGSPHKTKSIEELSHVSGEMPEWFRAAMEAVRLAPTAINQQRFLFTLEPAHRDEESEGGIPGAADGAEGEAGQGRKPEDKGNGEAAPVACDKVRAEALRGLYAHVDLGIARYHFEVGAAAAGHALGTDWQWA
ncbi:MAG: nitroreductase family protein [Coriobacteriaceae bacterium]|jgi:nitroreductase|nr:nitroreductase family protein [Coriobacteriaceae bacterium]